MGPVEALQIALAKEKQSIQMYEKYSLDFPSAKEIFLFLVLEEQKHQQMLEKKIFELTR